MLKKRFILLFFSLTISVTIMAQGHYGSDTIAIFSQQYKKNAFALKSTALKDSSQKYYGVAQITQQYKTGELRRAQDAYVSNKTSFYTEGYHTLGKFWLAGSFLFNKTVEDSLANSLRRDDDDISPYYYFAAKNGRYERQNYIANAIIDYSLIPGKLNVGTKINYENHWTTRSVDPRPSVKDFKLVLSPEVAYTINPQQKIGIGLNWGYGYEETNIAFKNSEYLQSLAYPDRIHYINQGYGYISIKDTTSLRRYKDYSGFLLNYQFEKDNFSAKFYGNYSKKIEENTHDIKSRTRYFVRERFTLNEYDLQLLLTKTSTTNIQQLDFNTLIREGSDWNSAFRKNNYTAQDNFINFNYSFLWKKDKPKKHQAELSLYYESILRSDAAAAHELSTESIQPELKYTFYHQNKNTDKWFISLATSYKKPLSTTMSVPTTQINVFSKGVMFPDYYYYGSTILGFKNRMNYISNNLIKNFRIGFSLDTEFYTKTNTSMPIYDAQFIPQGNRFNILGGINIYL